MEYMDILQGVLEQSGNIQNVLAKYVILLQLVGVVFCLVNCLFGYKLRKFWSAVMVFIIGGSVILAAGSYFMDNKIGAVATALVAGLLLAILSVQVYRIALFVACAGLTYWVLSILITDPITLIKVIFVLMGIIVGRMVLRFERPLVILITGICGGLGASKLLFMLLENDGSQTMLIVGLVASVVGVILQFITSSVDEDEEEVEEHNPAHSHKKRKKHKKKRPVEKSVFQLMRESMQGEDEDDDEDELEEYYDEEEYEYVEPVRRRHSSVHTYDEILDMDDINKEMSQEIQQIYNEKKRNR